MTHDGYFFSADSLTVGYNGRPLISGINVGLERGEILTLIGPNGSGKSTILKSITKHLAAISGVVYIAGRSWRAMSSRETATRLAVVLTERVKPELMTCGELVASGRYPYTNSFGMLTARDKEAVAAALERVRASELRDREFTTLSDGQRQRVMLARAICQEPEIIVLDEPTSFLDIRHKIELLGILRDMAKKQKITVIMSLHEIDLAYKVSDRIMCVKGDRISALGPPDEIFKDDLIDRLYGLESGSYDSLLGSVELERPSGEPRAFVLGGGGCGIPFYHALQKAGVPFAAGIIYENDVDLRIADALAAEAVRAKAFEPFGEAEVKRARELISRVNTVVDSGCPVGEYNAANKILLGEAVRAGKRVIASPSEVNGLL